MAETDLDVVIVGAGVSGIAAGYHLQTRCPGKTYTILEARDDVGGTWDLFKYPGIRSDSDMSTFGYAFRPWTEGKVFADGPSIKRYVGETAAEHGIDQHIQFGKRVVDASWQTDRARWTLKIKDAQSDKTEWLTCRFLFMCSGYYRYEAGYMPVFKGMADFEGDIVHPQKWTGGEDYAGKKVAIIGSGATAVTLLPAMAPQAAHVTMIQRSPTYIADVPSVDRIGNFFRSFLPSGVANKLIRFKNILLSIYVFQLSKLLPGVVKRGLLKKAQEALGDGFDVETHFSPAYSPWDQRLCAAPDGDFFAAIKTGKASVVTDHIDRFSAKGIWMKSGDFIEADLIIPATGLAMQLFGGTTFRVDGELFDAPGAFSYRGMMFSGLPNLAGAIGYTNASWTLKVDLTCERVCKLLNYMDKNGIKACVPDPPADLQPHPLLNLNSGYITRAAAQLPKQGDRSPWRTHQNYILDMLTIRLGPINDGAVRFIRDGETAAVEAAE